MHGEMKRLRIIMQVRVAVRLLRAEAVGGHQLPLTPGSPSKRVQHGLPMMNRQ